MATKAGRGSDQFMLRLPEGMRDRIKASADARGRSMNAEIVALIEEGFEQREHFERLEAMHREHMDDPGVRAAFEQHERDMAEEAREHAELLRKASRPRVTLVIPPEGMSRKEIEAMLRKVVDNEEDVAIYGDDTEDNP